MGPGGGYKGNQPKGQVHLTNVEEPGRETQSTEIGGFNSEDIERLRNFLKTFEKLSRSCSFAQNGNTLNSYVLSASNKYISSTWVINSGATDHMTHFADWFTTYKPCSSNKKKSKLQMVHSSLKMCCMFSIFRLILLSSHKITQDLNCHVLFSNNHCVIQDRTTGRMIRQAKAMEGLYLLKDKDSRSDPLSLSLFLLTQIKMRFGIIIIV